ncbi:MAG: AzlC family ABC transporter permease [Haloplanus sp.]
MLPDDLLAGVRATLPLLLGLVPFGLVAGIAAVNAGLSPAQAVGLSAIVFAGAAQLAAVDLLGRDASLAVVVLTAVVINLRMVMYSASIAPYFESFRRRWAVASSYLLTDMSYALAITEFQNDSGTDRRWYYIGAAATMWGVWQIATVVGALLGTRVPSEWGIGFAVPLVFLSLLVSDVSGRPRVVAAVVGGGVAVVGGTWPLNLGLIGGALAGVAAGAAVDGRGRDA